MTVKENDKNPSKLNVSESKLINTIYGIVQDKIVNFLNDFKDPYSQDVVIKNLVNQIPSITIGNTIDVEIQKGQVNLAPIMTKRKKNELL